jgi:hypothetical protein
MYLNSFISAIIAIFLPSLKVVVILLSSSTINSHLFQNRCCTLVLYASCFCMGKKENPPELGTGSIYSSASLTGIDQTRNKPTCLFMPSIFSLIFVVSFSRVCSPPISDVVAYVIPMKSSDSLSDNLSQIDG